jgi:hypothetical protein
MPNEPWYQCSPGCEVSVPCGQGRHVVRWDAGSLLLPEHPDAEAELVLAALGGDKAGCVELAEAWGRHTDDLSVLAIGPRGPDDAITVSWEVVAALKDVGPATFAIGQAAMTRAGLPSTPASVPPAVAALHRERQRDLERTRLRRLDMLSLLALGYGFQLRLAGQVAAAHADSPGEKVRPALVAAIEGRLAPVAERWLGIDADQVAATLLSGAGWGSVELTGRGADRRLRVSLPAGWLARVWACGLALVDRHLVVGVLRPGWPDARVLALRAPGAEPVPLDVHGTAGARDAPHWEA